MPFCTWVFCGDRRRGRGLVGILWGRPEARPARWAGPGTSSATRDVCIPLSVTGPWRCERGTAPTGPQTRAGGPHGFEDHADIRGSMHAGRRQRVADGDQASVPWRLSHSVIDSAGPAGAEFARNADSARLKPAAWNGRLERRWPVPVRAGWAAAPAQPGARERDRLLAAGLRCAELRGSVASGTADRCSDVHLCWVVPDEMFAAAVEPPSGRSDPRVRWHRYASTPTSLSQTAAGSSASGWWALRCSGASISTSVQPPGQ